MFHLCYPVQEPTTQEILFQRFSFVCSDNAVFDQQHLVCVDNETLTVRCEDAPAYFGPSNDKLIASLHQNQQAQQQQHQQQQQYAYAQPKSADQYEEVEEEVVTETAESAMAETVVAPANASSPVSDDETAQYGALLESLFG